MPAFQSRFMMFTLNNCRIKGEDLLNQWFTDKKIVFGVCQLEKGEKGTPHLQGYVVCAEKKRTLAWCQKELFRGHWEIRKGTHEQARDYCTKDDTRQDGPWSVGEWDSNTEGARGAGQRHKALLDKIKEEIDSGASNRDLYNNYFGSMMRYKRSFDDYRLTMRDNVRGWHTNALVLYGPPGTGKSKRAAELSVKLFGVEDTYWWRANEKWWDGYQGQKCVVIDEFYGQAPCNFMMRLLDRYPLQVETKGGAVNFVAQMVIITSNKHPEQWYGPEDPTTQTSGDRGVPVVVRDALMRRMQGKLGQIIHMDELVEEEPEQPDFADILAEAEAAADQQREIEVQDRNKLECQENLTESEEALIADCQEEDEENDGWWNDEDAADDDEPNEDEDEIVDGWEEHTRKSRLSGGYISESQLLAADGTPEEDTAQMVANTESTPKTPAAFQAPKHAPKVYCDCDEYPCDGVELLKKLRRTDSNTFGIEKVKDKRVGKEPVQSKLKFSARRVINLNDDDDNDN